METSQAKVNAGHDLAATDTTKTLSSEYTATSPPPREDGGMPQPAPAQTLQIKTTVGPF